MVSNKNSANLTITIDIQTTARKKKDPLEFSILLPCIIDESAEEVLDVFLNKEWNFIPAIQPNNP